jgi:hypothetical protein
MMRLQRWENGPYFTDFFLHIPDMSVKIVKIYARSAIVSINRMFRYRTPESDRLLAPHFENRQFY